MSKSRARTEAGLAADKDKADPAVWAGQSPGPGQERVRVHLREGQGPSVSFKALRLRILFLSLN